MTPHWLRLFYGDTDGLLTPLELLSLQMAQHKIQSSTGLTLELAQVPKLLGRLTNEWAPRSYVVSFKLETDEAILFKKAGGAIRNYAVNLVVANLLHSRADLCYLVATAPSTAHSDGKEIIRGAPSVAGGRERVELVDGRRLMIQVVQREAGEAQIEPLLVQCVVAQYHRYLRGRGVSSTPLAIGPSEVRAYVDMITHASEDGGSGTKNHCGCNGAGGQGCWLPLVASVAMLALGVMILRKDRVR